VFDILLFVAFHVDLSSAFLFGEECSFFINQVIEQLYSSGKLRFEMTTEIEGRHIAKFLKVFWPYSFRLCSVLIAYVDSMNYIIDYVMNMNMLGKYSNAM